jgi:hypothetical protein
MDKKGYIKEYPSIRGCFNRLVGTDLPTFGSCAVASARLEGFGQEVTRLIRICQLSAFTSTSSHPVSHFSKISWSAISEGKSCCFCVVVK